MSYSRDNLACSSWHKNDRGQRQFCRLDVSHYGDHEAYFDRKPSGYRKVTWANKAEGVWLDWMKVVVKFGLQHIYDNPPNERAKEVMAEALQIVEDHR